MKLSALEDYPTIRERVEAQREYIEVLRSAAEQTTTIMSLTPKGQGYSKDKLLGYVVKLLEAAEMLCEETLHLSNLRKEIDEWMDGLTERERLVIRAKYIDREAGEGVTWTDASRKANYSERQMYRIHADMINRGALEEDGSKCQCLNGYNTV